MARDDLDEQDGCAGAPRRPAVGRSLHPACLGGRSGWPSYGLGAPSLQGARARLTTGRNVPWSATRRQHAGSQNATIPSAICGFVPSRHRTSLQISSRSRESIPTSSARTQKAPRRGRGLPAPPTPSFLMCRLETHHARIPRSRARSAVHARSDSDRSCVPAVRGPVRPFRTTCATRSAVTGKTQAP